MQNSKQALLLYFSSLSLRNDVSVRITESRAGCFT